MRHVLSRGLVAVALAAGVVTLAGDGLIAGGARPMPTPHRHDPNKIHERFSEGNYSSYNWSGYAVTRSNVTDVKGSWVVPAVSCTPGGKKQTQNQYSSFWVGIDGFNSNSVEQIGTDSDCQNGRPNYYAWYEFYPNPSYYLPGVSANPGDVISAEVIALGNQSFKVVLTNVSTGESNSVVSQASNAKLSSAEWIAEAPSGLGGILPLANFGTVSFGHNAVPAANTATAGTSTGPIGSFGADTQSITMVDKNPPHAIKAQPSGLDGDSSGFGVTWKSAGP